jgi:uncharacterized protein (DUF1499 family)
MMNRPEQQEGWDLRRGKRAMLTIIVVLAAIVGVGGIGLHVYLGREAESRLAAGEVVDFAARASAGRDNVFAACPTQFCTPSGNIESPIFNMGWERLLDYWREVIDAQRNVELVAEDRGRHRLTYIQRSAVLRFPDIVTVEFVPLGDERSSLAIDSRSRYGVGDLGVNRRRVTAWLDLLLQMTQRGRLPSDAAPHPANAP